jgi:hypothetical protein
MYQETHAVVVLDRTADVPTPEYCVHGYATCVACGAWCYLGSESVRLVESRHVKPLCMVCAPKVIPLGMFPSGKANDRPHKDDE